MPETCVPGLAVGVIVTGIVVLWPGSRCTGSKCDESPLAAVHRSPVAESTVGSKACVTASNVALAVSGGAPDGPYGPISLGTSAQRPGSNSSPELSDKLALLP